jgi:hypothetical protein
MTSLLYMEIDNVGWVKRQRNPPSFDPSQLLNISIPRASPFPLGFARATQGTLLTILATRPRYRSAGICC